MSEDEKRASSSDLNASSGAIETSSPSSSSKSRGCAFADGDCAEYASPFFRIKCSKTPCRWSASRGTRRRS
ncbi:hypothetical protein U1Q18_019544 [Sarracenia purpurea var. burkii]